MNGLTGVDETWRALQDMNVARHGIKCAKILAHDASTVVKQS